MTPQPVYMLVVGDSIALGITDIVAGEVRTVSTRGFVDQLRERLPHCHIEVNAAMHRTTSHAVELLPDLLQQLAPKIVLFVLGGSDADINWRRFIITDGRRVQHNTPPPQFEKNLRALAAEVQLAGALVVFATLPEHDVIERGRLLSALTGRDVVSLLEAGGGSAESDRVFAVYSEIMDRVAQEMGAGVARWTDRVRAMPSEQRRGPDAIHPSDAAHDVIAEVVAEVLAHQTPCKLSPTLATVQS